MTDEPQMSADMVNHKEVLAMLEEQDKITGNFYSQIDEQMRQNFLTDNYAFDELAKNLAPSEDLSW
jgi:hypothetical protein